MDKLKKVFWCFPWGYAESIVIVLGILFCGIFIDLVTNKPIPIIKFPFNIIVGFILILSLIVASYKYKNKGVTRWINSYYASITSVCLFGFISIIMALIPQGGKSSLFIYNITSSYTYFLSYFFFLVVLGMVILKRVIPFKIKNIGFLFSHLGLWVVLFAAGIGYGDIQKMTMYLREGETVWYAEDKENKKVELPLALKLKDFDIEEYNSKLGIIDNTTGEIIKVKGKPYVQDVLVDKFFDLYNYKIKINKYYKYSVFNGERFNPIITPGSVSSALVQINNTKKWISCSGLNTLPKSFKIDNYHSLVLLQPCPKRFYSKVTVYEKDGIIRDEIIEVNKPITVKGWRIYQSSYDKTHGKWSKTSIVELVKDPWLNITYIGCVLIILGAFDMIWRGRRNNFKA